MINKRYKIIKKLGEGRSKVFLCIDNEFPGMEFAIKLLPSGVDPAEIETLHREFITLKRIEHPSFVKAFEKGVVTENNNNSEISLNSHFITIEYFDGVPLTDFYREKDEEKLRNIIVSLCSSLYYLHQSDYIYYDLKPENILVKDFNSQPRLKLIDFGFAEKYNNQQKSEVKGTAEYIAPELLNKSPHNHSVDLYSLGIILYRLVYNRFPFNTTNEMEIYKAHLDQEFSFPQSSYSEQLITVIKKLLKKDISLRYSNSLQVIEDLGAEIGTDIVKDFLPAKVFADRKDSLAILGTYIKDKSSSEVFIIKGFEGSGKSFLAEEISRSHSKVVLLKNSGRKTGYDFILYFVRKLIYHENVYPNLPQDVIKKIEELDHSGSAAGLNNLKEIITIICSKYKLILVLDDFNLYDAFTREIFREMIPLMQANRIKVIITEDSDYDQVTGFINNQQEINLTPFTEAQVEEFITESYAAWFPREEMKKLVMLYADLLPGNIYSFIRDVILLGVLKYSGNKITIVKDEDTDRLLKSSHDVIYKMRLSFLDETELKAAKIISLFDSAIENKILASLLKVSADTVEKILRSLKEKNIVQLSEISNEASLTSLGLKKYIYSSIGNTRHLHKEIAEKIRAEFPYFDRPELARQYELAEDYENAFLTYKEDIDSGKNTFAYSYKRNVLEHLLRLPLKEELKNQITVQLVETLYKLSDFPKVIEYSDKILSLLTESTDRNELMILKGSSLIGTGEFEKGRDILIHLLPEVTDPERRQKLLVEITNAEFELKNTEKAKALCYDILANKNTGLEEKGKCYNLLGLIEILYYNNTTAAIKHLNSALECYEKAGSKLRVAAIEVNLGNLFNIRGESSIAEKHWNKALEINQSIGSLSQQANQLLNYGIYYFDKGEIEKAIEDYEHANRIFLSLGNKQAEGLVYTNLAEALLLGCDYQAAVNNARAAISIFENLNVTEDLTEGYYILSRIFIRLGSVSEVKIILENFSKLNSQSELSVNQKLKLEFLQSYLRILDYDDKESINRLEEIKNKFYDSGDLSNYAEVNRFLIESFISSGNSDGALRLLNEEKYLNYCSKNILFDAEIDYFLGRISESVRDSGLLSAIEYFDRAYNKLKEHSVTETTWLVLYSIGRIYYERGNYTRAFEYVRYCDSLLEYIGSRFSDRRLKKIFFEKPERKEAIENLRIYLSNCQK